MSSYEYITVPAPMRSEKAKGAKTPAERYAVTLTEAINRMAAEGWEYLRADTLPSEERSGLTGRTTLFHNLLVFRREIAATKPVAVPAPAVEVSASTPAPVPAPVAAAAEPSPVFSEKMQVAEQLATEGTVIETAPGRG
ncbi:MAG: DUF4177 domain-containing protein [Paracoccus sp. (in: a-proteobacteria)]